MYRIEKIVADGKERTDGRYPLRKGCIGDFWCLNIGEPMIFAYSKDNEGNDKTGYLRTSVVEDYENYDGYTVVYTINSIYTLKKL